MNMSRFAAALFLLAILTMHPGQAQPRKHLAARSKGTASLRHVVSAGSTARGKAHGRASGRDVVTHGVPRGHAVVEHATATSRHLSSAFIASAALRPMAQQLLATRSSAAYSGVLGYAAAHPGEAASAANLAVAHAYALDHRYSDAEGAFRSAAGAGDALADYADYLGAQAAISAGRPGDAVALLEHFSERHPDSLFVPQAPVLLANAYLAGNQPAQALSVLQPLASGPTGEHLDVRVALAKAYQASGNAAAAASLYRTIYLSGPTTNEAANAKVQLAILNIPLTPGERKEHADALFNAKQYSEAATEYRALEKNEASLSQADRDALEIYAAVCDLRLKRITRGDVDHLPVTSDDTAALKMYLQSELARNEGNPSGHDALVQGMTQQYPNSRWLEEALYSGGNMYLIKRDATHAIQDYSELVGHFPRSVYAPSAHWRTAWLNYRLRHNADAARMFDEQITMYPGGQEIPGALYWRGRLYEDVEGNFGQAQNYYKALNAAYVNSYYAMLGRQRLAVIGSREAAAPSPVLAAVRAIEDPHLTDALPEDDPHLIKARLLANAALNEYIRPEIQLSPTSMQWGALAEAQIYQSFGENARALQAMKRSKVPFSSLPVAEVPTEYWQLVFPRPYWQQLSSDAQTQGLDPYLVASLIRQESEFNPGAVSRANACGLMQLLPSTAKGLAKHEGERHFSANELFDPTENLRLGTTYLRQNI
ncbi:MAG: transglycosylase SLT domain-containing protein, partial [Janthinobacterium lividum]